MQNQSGQRVCPKCGRTMERPRSIFEVDQRRIPVSVYVCRDCAAKWARDAETTRGRHENRAA